MSNVSAAVNSRDLITNSQRVLDKDAIIGLSFDMKKGNEQPLMYTVNEMNGNFCIFIFFSLHVTMADFSL